MTNEQRMPPCRRRRSGGRVGVALAATVVLALAGSGCQRGPRLTTPARLHAPIDAPRVWAVAPLANESGVSIVDTARLTDALVQEVEQVEGLQAVPQNRVLAAMRALSMPSVDSPADARTLLHVLGVDAILVGTITAYDPYPPPRLGMALALYEGVPAGDPSFDPRDLVRSPRGVEPPGGGSSWTRPRAEASGVFDAANHDVLRALRDYAGGRTTPESAYGPRVYEMSMPLFGEFVGFRLLEALLGSYGPGSNVAAEGRSFPPG